MKQEKIMRVNELAERIHRGEQVQRTWEDLYKELREYKGQMVSHYANKYSSFNISRHDLEEAFDIALVNSVKKYKFNADDIEVPPFFYYFQTAANTECKSVLRSAQAGAKRIMCGYTSFSAPASTTKDGDSVEIGEAIPDTFSLEDSVISSIETSPKILQALSTLKEKDATIIKIQYMYPDKKDRKLALQQYLTGVKDATIRKNVQRAKERFAKALEEVGVTC